jgi:hypothetical protein
VDDGRNAAAIFEQSPLVLRMKMDVGEAGEMENSPEAIVRCEKLWPATAALRAGLRPQKITSSPVSRISGS